MGLFDRLFGKNATGKQRPQEPSVPAGKHSERGLDAIDLIALDTHLAHRCEFGDALGLLSDAQRRFYLVQTLEREVNNGGFDQFFLNSSGDHAHETVLALLVIGANKTSDLLQRAMDRFPQKLVPANRDERHAAMTGFAEEPVFEDLDTLFYAYEDNLEELCLAFIQANASDFVL